MAAGDTTVIKTFTKEEATSADLNAEFSNIYTNMANKSGAQTISGRKTHSAGIILDELVAIDAAGAGDVKLTEFRWDPASGTATDADGMYIPWMSDDDGGNDTEYGRQHLEFVDTGAASEDSAWHFSVQVAATLTDTLQLTGTALAPSVDNAIALGVTSTFEWSDLFLASGAVIGWNNSDVVLTHSANTLTLTGGSTLVTEAVTLGGTTQANSTVTVGVDDTGYDVKFFGDTATNNYALWDASGDHLILRQGVSGQAEASQWNLVLESSANAGMSIFSANNGSGAIDFGDDGDVNIGQISYFHTGNEMKLVTNNGNRVVISSAGVVQIPQLTASNDVQTDGSSNLTSVSDKTWKNDLGVVTDGLAMVRAIDPHYFTWKRDSKGNTVKTPSVEDDKGLVTDYKVVFEKQPRLAGFFAQDVYDEFPEGAPGGANTDADGVDHWGLNSRALLAALWVAVQELDKKVN